VTRTILFFGLVAGLIAGGVGSLMAITSMRLSPAVGMAIGYLTMLIALSTIFVAVKRHRDGALGGAIRFWPAFGLGLAISVVAGIVYALCWEVALASMGGPDAFIDGYIAQMRAGDPTGTADQVRQMESMRASYRNPAFRLPITFTEIAPVGVLVSLVAAALLRNPHFLPARREGLAA
jgi:hypothetical protein